MMLETIPDLAGYQLYFDISDAIVAICFTVEYLAFWSLSKNKLRFPFSVDSMIDLLAILPFYLHFGSAFLALRSIRFLRIFRILKLSRYNRAFDTITLAVLRCRTELLLTGYIAIIVILLSSTALYIAECDAQPEAYSSIPAAMWSAIATLTTVGYGDAYPVTTIGKIIAVAVMLTGIGFVAVPTGLISSQLTAILQDRRERERSHMKQFVHYQDDV